ncbi:MAG: copper-binding protein, partial [Verrucomicrobiota bacterium]
MKAQLLPPAALLVALLVALPACRRTTPVAAPAPAEKHYPLTGEVVQVDTARKILRVHHDAVADYMQEMTMEFSVSAADAAVAKEGGRIRAQLYPDGPQGPRLKQIWPVDPVAEAAVAAAT